MKIPTTYHNLTPAGRARVREEYVRRQGGNCAHCGQPLVSQAAADVMRKRIRKELFPGGFFKYPVHLHHDHATGMTIGAVHCYCNAVLWQYYGR